MTQLESSRRARRATGPAGRGAETGDPRSSGRGSGGSGGGSGESGSDGLPEFGGGRSRRASSSSSSGHSPADSDLARRGSHATPQGQGFSWVLLWTILGALIPGVGLVAAGWRRLGALLLVVVGIVAVALLTFAKFGDITNQGLKLAVDPKKLLLLAVLAGIGGLLWASIVLLTTTQLRRFANLTGGQSAFAWVVVLALVVGVALPTYKVSSYAMITRSVFSSKSVFQGGNDAADTSSGPSTQQADPWAGTPQINILLIGSDAGADRTGIRPDTMILASINTKTGNTVLLSLPRSLQHAPFPAGTGGHQAFPNGYWCPDQSCLLNAIWTWASGDGRRYYSRFKNPGLRATEDAVEGVTGLKVDNYVMLNLNGFRDFVDAIGGVTVDVHDRLPIGGNGDPTSPLYHKAPGGYIEIGNHQHLDGYHALWFARSRWAFDDYNRMKRQRCVIGDVVSQTNPAKLALNFPAIAKTLKKNLSTGIKTTDLSAWVDLAQRVKGASVKSLVFDPQVINTVNPNFTKVHSIVAKAVEATAHAPSASATPTTAASPSSLAGPGAPTPSATKTKKPKASSNPAKAQNVKAVC